MAPLVVAAALLAGVPYGSARLFNALIPNMLSVPCINKEGGCHGQATCESFAHEDCYPFKPINDFGELYEGSDSNNWQEVGKWDLRKCTADSDNDGFTNGWVCPCLRDRWRTSHLTLRASAHLLQRRAWRPLLRVELRHRAAPRRRSCRLCHKPRTRLVCAPGPHELLFSTRSGGAPGCRRVALC